MITDLTASVVSHATLIVVRFLEHWKNAVNKAKSWIFLDKEYENCAKMRYIH
jgi:hypothetical protein